MNPRDIANAIDFWHEMYNGPLAIWEWLGLSLEEYDHFLITNEIPESWNDNS